MVDGLIHKHEKSGIVDEKQEFLIKNAAAQIFGGLSYKYQRLLYTYSSFFLTTF